MVAESLPYGWQERSPKQVAAIVLLILMAMVLSFVELPVVPGAEWLKYDRSCAGRVQPDGRGRLAVERGCTNECFT